MGSRGGRGLRALVSLQRSSPELEVSLDDVLESDGEVVVHKIRGMLCLTRDDHETLQDLKELWCAEGSEVSKQ
jgi:hypothetical protein